MDSKIKSFLKVVVERLKAIGRWLMKESDPILKLTGTVAIVAGTWIVHSYESKLSAVTLLSQREQSESQLRSSMFSNLITPITGPQKAGEITPHRERLLVELLALNFHEHFQFKPLMLHVDKRLCGICRKKDERDIKQAEYNRKSLRSIARRITQTQIKTLYKEGLPAQPRVLRFELPMIKIEDNKSKDKDNKSKDKALLEKVVENKIVLKDGDSLYFYNKSEEELKNKLLKKAFDEEEIQNVLTLWQDMLIQQGLMIEVKVEDIEWQDVLIQQRMMIGVKAENTEEDIKPLPERLVEKKVALRRNENNDVLYFYNESKEEFENKLIEKEFKEEEIKTALSFWENAGAGKNASLSPKSLNKMYKIEVPEDKDRRWLWVGIMDIDSENETVDVVFSTNYEENISTEQKFTLTWYDFPFTDYSILPNGIRFSLVLDDMEIDDDILKYKVNLKIIWYPKDYFTAHERPINYKEFRENLGI